MNRAIAAAIVVFCALPTATLAQEKRDEIPAFKKTIAGLYVCSTEAYAKWRADPDRVKIIDVRTPEEYYFVGHGAMAWNVPLRFQVYAWDAEKGKPKMNGNPNFVEQVKRIAKSTDTLFVICRSGKRGPPAIDLLTKAGFKRVVHIVNGFEGDKVEDPGSAYFGKRMRNGWKNSGVPWTYDIDPKLMYIERRR